jgi:hypothetical protein
MIDKTKRDLQRDRESGLDKDSEAKHLDSPICHQIVHSDGIQTPYGLNCRNPP